MAKQVTIYGIKNCDTMKKARAWLDERGVAYAFHDYKSAGVERETRRRRDEPTAQELAPIHSLSAPSYHL